MALPSPAWQNQFGPLAHTSKRAVLSDKPGRQFYGPFCFAGVEVDANLFGGTFTDTNPYNGLGTNGYGGTGTDVNAGLGGTETNANPYTGAGTLGYGGTQNSGCLSTMQAVNITLGEFNDETINLTITNNASAFNLSGYGLQALLKTAAGVSDTDPSTKTYTTGGAITITNAPGGLATLVIPHADLANVNFTFWRLDVTIGGTQATAMYGTVTMKAL